MSSKKNIIPYNSNLKELARDLRKKMTLSEVLLWNQLKRKNMMGFDFDRQRPIDNFIVDFYCKELSLAIEIDGNTHIYRDEEDERRQAALENLGVRFLRFDDVEVKKNITNVLRVIEDWITKNQPTPRPNDFPSKLTNNFEVSSVGQADPPPKRGRLSGEGNLTDKNPNRRSNKTLKTIKRNLIKNDLIREIQPTPDPSEEGNL